MKPETEVTTHIIDVGAMEELGISQQPTLYDSDSA